MRHQKARKRMGTGSSHRKAILRNMVTSLFKHEQLETTDAKAKQLKPVAEKMITLAKRGDLHARRQALSFIREKDVTHRLFSELKDRYMDRQGGYTRVVKKGYRKGDGAAVSIVQLLPGEGEKKARKKDKAAKEKVKVESPKETPKTEAVEKKVAPPEPEKDAGQAAPETEEPEVDKTEEKPTS